MEKAERYLQWFDANIGGVFDPEMDRDPFAPWVMTSELEKYPGVYAPLVALGASEAAHASQTGGELDQKRVEALVKTDSNHIAYRVTSAILAALDSFITALRSIIRSA